MRAALSGTGRLLSLGKPAPAGSANCRTAHLASGIGPPLDQRLRGRLKAFEPMRAHEHLECIGGEDDSKLEHVALKTASMRLYQLFKQFDAIDFSASVENKPEAYTRLFSALPRITREALRYQKYRDACAQARAEVQKLKDPKRKLTDSERLAIVHKVDEILGLRSPDHDDHESNPAPHPEIASFDS